MSANHAQVRTRSFREAGELFREHYSFVWRSVRRLVVTAAAAEDAAQDVFVVAFRRLRTLAADASPRAWLFGIARRVAFRYRRSAQRRDRKVDALRASVGDHAEPSTFAHVDAVLVLDKILRRLEPKTRHAFVLSELEGLSGPEVAQALGIKSSTAYSRVRLARRQWSHAARTMRAEDRRIERWFSAHSQTQQRDALRSAHEPARESTASGFFAAFVRSVLGTSAVKLAAGSLVVAAGIGASAVAARPAPSSREAAGTELQAVGRPRSAAPAVSQLASIQAQRSLSSSASPQRQPARPSEADVTAAPTRSDRPLPASPPSPINPALTDPLTTELATLQAAKGELAADRPAEALRRLEPSYTSGALTDAAAAIRVDALCQLGRVHEARRIAHKHRADHPESAALLHPHACNEADRANSDPETRADDSEIDRAPSRR